MDNYHPRTTKIFLTKLAPGVNFINVLRTIFLHELRLSCCVLALSKYLYKKFACLTLMKLTAGVNSINILQAPFSYKSVLSSFSLLTVRLCNFFALLVKCWWNYLQNLPGWSQKWILLFSRSGLFLLLYLTWPDEVGDDFFSVLMTKVWLS